MKALRYLMEGNRTSVKQIEISEGHTYYGKDWTLKKKIQLIINLKKAEKFISIGQIQNWTNTEFERGV